MIQEPFDVGVQHMLVATSLEFQHPSHGHVTAPPRPEAIGVVMEDALEERVQEVANHLLSNAVGDCGNAQRACFPCISFWNVDTSQRKGLVSPSFQTTFERDQVLYELTLVQLNGHAIDARGPSVTTNAAEGFLEFMQVDTTCQGMRFDPGQSRSFPAGAHGTKDR